MPEKYATFVKDYLLQNVKQQTCCAKIFIVLSVWQLLLRNHCSEVQKFDYRL